MGEKNSSVTRVWPVFLELMCGSRTTSDSLRLLLDLVFKSSGNTLAAQLRDSAGEVIPSLIEKPIIPRTEYGMAVRLPNCFEYSVPPTERFLIWLIEESGRGCMPRTGLGTARKDAGRRPDLFGDNEVRRSDARKEAIRNLYVTGVNRSKNEWWVFEGPTSVDCFLETSDMVLFIEGKRTDSVADCTDWCPSRNQIARNLEAVQSIAKGKRYGVLLAAEKHIDISPSAIVQGLPHMSEPERRFLGEHYLGCVTWTDLCREAHLTFDVERDIPDVQSAEQWLRARGFIS
jgi:hypothetical protein